MGGLTKPQQRELMRTGDSTEYKNTFEGRSRTLTDDSSWRMQIDKMAEARRADEAERDRVAQQLEEVSRQREAHRESSEQAKQQFEAESNARANQQRALEQTGAVDSIGGTNKPYNQTPTTSTTVEGVGAGQDQRRKRNQLAAYLGI